MKEKFTIGLTGGIGSGKSRILELLKQEYGAVIIETDAVAKKLEEPGQPGFAALAEAFGDGIISEDGNLRKDLLTHMVFGNQETRQKINSLIHPLVWDYVKQQAGKGGFSILVAESALLLENPDDIFHELWYVYTARETRIQRLMKSRGYTREKCCLMMQGQPSEEEYRRHADFILDNNGSLDTVRGQIDRKLQPHFGRGISSR